MYDVLAETLTFAISSTDEFLSFYLYIYLYLFLGRIAVGYYLRICGLLLPTE